MNNTLIIDIKTGVFQKWHAVQLAGYWGLLTECRASPSAVEPEFRADGHRYFISGREVPSVSAVLKPLRPSDFRHDPADAQRGTDIHKMCEEYDLGTYREEYGTRNEKRKYLDAWRSWKTDTDYDWEESERIEWRLGSKKLWYAGTLDRAYGESGPISGTCVYLVADGFYNEKNYTAAELERLFNTVFRPLLEAEKIAREWR
jgi:hypothetical protein